MRGFPAISHVTFTLLICCQLSSTLGAAPRAGGAGYALAFDGLDGLEILGAREEADWSGMGAFRLAGRATPEDSQALQRRLQNEFGIFTVSRYGLASGACVRVTPQVYTSVDEIDALVAALRTIVASPS